MKRLHKLRRWTSLAIQKIPNGRGEDQNSGLVERGRRGGRLAAQLVKVANRPSDLNMFIEILFQNGTHLGNFSIQRYVPRLRLE